MQIKLAVTCLLHGIPHIGFWFFIGNLSIFDIFTFLTENSLSKMDLATPSEKIRRLKNGPPTLKTKMLCYFGSLIVIGDHYLMAIIGSSQSKVKNKLNNDKLWFSNINFDWMAPNYNFHGRERLIGPSLVRIERFHLAEGVYLGSDFGAATPCLAVLGILSLSAWEAIKTGSSTKLDLFHGS